MDQFQQNGIKQDYQNILMALVELNKFTHSLLNEVPRWKIQSMPTSYFGNDKPIVARTAAEKLWVECHGGLRDYTEVIGNLLDTNALKHNDALKNAFQKLDASQVAYAASVKEVLADYKGLEGCYSKSLFGKKPAVWKPGLNSRGEPIISGHSSGLFDAYTSDLATLRKTISSPNHKKVWHHFDGCSEAMDVAMDRVISLLGKQKEVPLAWTDSSGIAHHVKTQRMTMLGFFNSSSEVCMSLFSLKYIGKMGQVNPMTISEQSAASLKNVGILSGVTEKLAKEFLSQPAHTSDLELMQHLTESFKAMPRIKRIEALISSPEFDGYPRINKLRAALSHMHIPSHIEGAVAKEDVPTTAVSGAELGRCPVGLGGSGAGKSNHHGKHWCVDVLEGVGNVPSAYGYHFPR